MKKTVVSKIENKGDKKFNIPKSKDKDKDADIVITSDGLDSDFVVEKLSLDDVDDTGKPVLPTKYGNDDIVWLTNFSIRKKIGNDYPYINQSYKVTISGLSKAKKDGKKILIIDGNSTNNIPTEITNKVGNDDTIELTDGDPAIGNSPP